MEFVELKNFKDTFKYVKLLDVNDNNNLIKLEIDFKLSENVYKKNWSFPDQKPFFGLKKPQEWNILLLKNNPGLILIKNPFTSLGQRYWIFQCLTQYPRKCNKRNIDIDDKLRNIDDFWEFTQNNDVKLFDKLRWATLGYHHNWDTKVYNDSSKSEFPTDLADMVKFLSEALSLKGFQQAQAAIINYYHQGSTLSGHTDHSELDFNAPLFSISFGQSAVFLIGGKTIEEMPSIVIVESGDVVVMSEESRLAYHGIPKVFQTLKKPWNDFDKDDESAMNLNLIIRDEFLWKPFNSYVSKSRINLNVRQVFPK